MTHPTTAQVEAAQDAITEAKSEAHRLCKLYAETQTGWAPGTRLVGHHGVIVEVKRFLGTHPTQWMQKPLMECLRAKQNGEIGTRKLLIEIDTEGHWRHRWKERK